jgi:hypothetical protein
MVGDVYEEKLLVNIVASIKHTRGDKTSMNERVNTCVVEAEVKR